MAFKKTLAQRLFNISNISSQTLTNCRISSSSVRTRVPPDPNKSRIAPDPGDKGIFRRFLHRRAAFHPEISAKVRPLPIGENVMEMLKSMAIARDRIRIDGLRPPPANLVAPDSAMSDGTKALSIEDAKKLLRVAHLETVKSRLRDTKKSCIPYSEFVQICGQGCSDADQSLGLAKTLDESGAVIVLGNMVFLRPEQVAKAIEGLIPLPGAKPSDKTRKELEEMEKQKAEIDTRAESLVRRELWGGLGFLVVQTAAFMRLTFWELSWDVMEPICFYVTSLYFMAGYAFFLRTSKEPSFEGFFQSRFRTKQKRLMKLQNFDLSRYNELQQACNYPNSLSTSMGHTSAESSPFDSYEKMQVCVSH